uniref:Peptidase M14 domain-containing protein n=1 Tax=Cyprinodon variegatus TaxID=28743 RepID=A0A3Q2DGH1_CYPVA
MSSSPLLLLLLLLVPSLMLELRYHNNSEIEQYLLQVSAANPDITHLYSIGKSVKGNDSRCVYVGCMACCHENKY